MIELILMLSLAGVGQSTLARTPIQTCVWPNLCGKPAVELAQFKPCVWPNTCGKQQLQTPVLAQFEPCVWPRRCSGKRTDGLI